VARFALRLVQASLASDGPDPHPTPSATGSERALGASRRLRGVSKVSVDPTETARAVVFLR
jgi:hypothetical protein